VIEVDEAGIADATWRLFSLANLKAEPTAALALAAVLAQPGRFADARVCCIVTGGSSGRAALRGAAAAGCALA
jgi:threonine dehydratase